MSKVTDWEVLVQKYSYNLPGLRRLAYHTLEKSSILDFEIGKICLD